MRRSVVVGALGTAQTLAWGSSYYLPAIMADPIAHGLGLSRTAVFGLFSGALLLSAVLGPSVGRAIDNRGGRGVLALSNLVLAAGLVLLGVAQGFVTLALAWAVLGVGMAMGLYDPAFATLTGLYGRAARGPITGITLIAGFASTVGWPLSAFLDAQFGWRAACLIWAALYIVIGLPLNRLLIPRAPPPARAKEEAGERSPAPRGPWRSLLSCLRRPGLSPAPWLRICRASSKSPGPAPRRRLRPPLWSGRRRLRRGSWNSGRYGWCIRWFPHVWPLCCIRSGP
jgi:MFS family permease